MKKRLVSGVMAVMMVASIMTGCGDAKKDVSANADSDTKVEAVATTETDEGVSEETTEQEVEEVESDLPSAEGMTGEGVPCMENEKFIGAIPDESTLKSKYSEYYRIIPSTQFEISDIYINNLDGFADDYSKTTDFDFGATSPSTEHHYEQYLVDINGKTYVKNVRYAMEDVTDVYIVPSSLFTPEEKEIWDSTNKTFRDVFYVSLEGEAGDEVTVLWNGKEYKTVRQEI